VCVCVCVCVCVDRHLTENHLSMENGDLESTSPIAQDLDGRCLTE